MKMGSSGEDVVGMKKSASSVTAFDGQKSKNENPLRFPSEEDGYPLFGKAARRSPSRSRQF